ncbi:hypothetical protein RCH07_003383 [Arthrobacter sp. CG_A4]|nr:hypothetical protein [Arthrobacter sp. CG_A4]
MTSELLSREVDLETARESVPVVDFVVLIAAAHVRDEKMAAEEVLNDEGSGSALPVC